MGSGHSKVTSNVPIGEKSEGQTQIYRNSEHVKELTATIEPSLRTCQDIFLKNFKAKPNSEYLGYRPRENGVLAKRFDYYTWAQVEEKAKRIGSAIINLGLAPEKKQFRNYNIKFVGIYSKNLANFTLVDIACSVFGLTLMPIYDTLGEEATDYMLNETELETIFITQNHIKGLVSRVKSGNTTHLKNLVILDEEDLKEADLNDLGGLKLYKFSEILELGKDNIPAYPEVQPEDIAFFSYTSGTTGSPKGAMVSHKN